MHQIKLFKGIETDLRAMEQEVNGWLAENDVRVVNIFGNIAPQTIRPDANTGGASRSYSPSDLFMAVVYEKA